MYLHTMCTNSIKLQDLRKPETKNNLAVNTHVFYTHATSGVFC